MKGTTLRRRLALSMAALAVGILAAASAAIYFGASRMLYSNLDAALLAIAATEVASAIDSPEGGLHVHEEGGQQGLGFGYEKFVLIKRVSEEISVQTGNLRDGPPLKTDRRMEQRALRGEAVFGDLTRGAETFRAVYYPMRDNLGNPLVAIVAIPELPLSRTLQLLATVALVALILGGIAAAWAADRLARYLTRPLEEISEAARDIGESNLAARIPEVSRDAELAEVTAILNAMLARLEAAFEAQKRFAADASHELRSPLNNLRGTVEVALRRPRNAIEYRETLEASLTEIDRLCRLVQDLLTLSRADAGQSVVERRPCDLTAIAEASVKAHAARADDEGVRLELSAAGPLEVQGDSDRLREVVDNLLDNALRHAPQRSVVEVVAGRDGARAFVGVRDSGEGLSAEDQVHVFERFYRADGSRDRRSGGLGLGLAIAKAIADAHGGEMKVRSEPGRGSEFSLWIPLSA